MMEGRCSGRCTLHPDDDLTIPITERPAREVFGLRLLTVP
jgi:hypothetical protein